MNKEPNPGTPREDRRLTIFKDALANYRSNSQILDFKGQIPNYIAMLALYVAQDRLAEQEVLDNLYILDFTLSLFKAVSSLEAEELLKFPDGEEFDAGQIANKSDFGGFLEDLWLMLNDSETQSEAAEAAILVPADPWSSFVLRFMNMKLSEGKFKYDLHRGREILIKAWRR